uniref:(northern house mosquito) hypothetical protein n=1 Tax=Culex pipiens TaxID=7175 RepID=A0A8D8FFF9_CULPI
MSLSPPSNGSSSSSSYSSELGWMSLVSYASSNSLKSSRLSMRRWLVVSSCTCCLRLSTSRCRSVILLTFHISKPITDANSTKRITDPPMVSTFLATAFLSRQSPPPVSTVPSAFGGLKNGFNDSAVIFFFVSIV